VAARDYENRRGQGQLLHLKKAEQKGLQTAHSPLSYSPDSLVRYGSTVMLNAGGVGPLGAVAGARFLASNIYLPVGGVGSRVTATTTAAPTARNTFVLLRPGADPREVLHSVSSARDEDVLLYGDRVILAANPALVCNPATGAVGVPLVLTSFKANIALGNTRKGMQEVIMAPLSGKATEAEWLIVAASNDRLMTDGTPVRAGDAVQLVHGMSNVPLASSRGETFPTDFGEEPEVHAIAYKGTGVKGMSSDGVIPVQAAQSANTWAFAYASSPAAARETRRLVALSPELLMEQARSLVAHTLGPNGIRSLALALASLDPRGSGYVPREAARLALFDHGAALSDEQAALLFGAFAAAGTVGGQRAGLGRGAATALLPKDAFVEALRGVESFDESRQSVVRAAYAHLSSAGPVTMGSLRAAFDGKFDPRVLAAAAPGAPKHGGMTSTESALEFGRQWPSHPRSSDPVTLGHFLSYYADVSAAMEDTEAFDSFVYNVWHVTGRGSWKPAGGLRVQVDMHNGSSTTIVLPGGANIDTSDYDALTEACAQAGLGGIARIKVLGIVE
jgi:hypothetical protein